ncbi:odorant receptor 10a [Scaptodrosophila lebanonensis]|uniref:Odorant receptor n=1 Tax=Drosophila lebanonensis TaxID=7225 RepID=A0A6J2TXF8_DROLE|nr:odorant receptor 10a [Scaptodrosophila lebanonensis]
MVEHFKFLRRNQPLKLYFFAVPRLCLGIMGYWPVDVQNRAYFNFLVLGIGVATELHAGFSFLKQAQITLALETLCPAVTSAVTLLKMFLMLRYRRDLAYVLARLNQLLFGLQSELGSRQEKRVIMRRHCMLAARLNFWPLSTGFFTCTTYNLKPLLIALLLYRQGHEVVFNPPFNMTMPRLMLQSPFFPLTYMFIAYTGYVTIFMFGGCDAFYFEFCTHTAALFKSLQADLRGLFQPYGDHLELSAEQCLHIERGLLMLIRRHNEIIELTIFFRQRYTIITLAHFLSAGVVIAISIIDLLTVSDNGLGTLLYVAFTVAALSQLLIYCYGGTLVAESSARLAIVVGSCPWQLCKPRQRRYILLLILRSQRAVSMEVPFFVPLLATFASILQTSGSIIALAKSFQ